MNAVLTTLAARYPVGSFAETDGPDPFRVLISCILSLRTRDDVTARATERLFARAKTPKAMLALRQRTIAKAIYPVSFYNTKSRSIRAICRILLERHRGRVPDTIDGLLELPGVGRKTANLTVMHGYGKPGICVDTHVHRISNRLGWVKTKTPNETEAALRVVLPRRWWIPSNETLVHHGQQVCKPISPICSICPVTRLCPRIGVTRCR